MRADRGEWLEADGLGGFASGTLGLERTRRYHALLLVATTPPTGRVVLVNGLEAWLETPAGTVALSTQRYLPDVVHPDARDRLEDSGVAPWPHWRFRLPDGRAVEHEIVGAHGAPVVALAWRLRAAPGAVGGSGSRPSTGANDAPVGDGATTLAVRLLLSGRDYHALHHENPAFRFDAETAGERIVWRPYRDLPGIVAVTNGAYAHAPAWYRRFLYVEERERGLDCVEDLASPGVLRFDLARGEAVLLLAATPAAGNGCTATPLAPARASAMGGSPGGPSDRSVTPSPVEAGDHPGPVPAWTIDGLLPPGVSATCAAAHLRDSERTRRQAFATPLARAADAYVVARGARATVIAGYPWFTDWGRDTFIAVRGLCIATGRLADAHAILRAWAGAVSEGMLPNRFPDRGDAPEFNSVDAALWYVVAAHDLLDAARGTDAIDATGRHALERAIERILQGYAAGTRYGIRLDGDGLLAAGVPGMQLTWMDARVGDRVVTPRIGKPVELQALWLNALWIGRRLSARWRAALERGTETFRARFWCEDGGYLHDVVDVDHRAGAVDATFRPNQLLAAGGLPLAVLDGASAGRMVDAVERRLWTPGGPRSLAPDEPGYAGSYQGDPAARDAAYHQGTAWPWLAGPFIEAWVRVRGGTSDAKREARARFLTPLLAHLDPAGHGHLPEIADGDPPHLARGCPFQAWSVGEALRLDRVVLAI